MSEQQEDGVGEAVWAALAARLQTLNDWREEAPDHCAAMDRSIALEFQWASNALDGNGLAREEVVHVLETGLAVGGRPLFHHMEALDQRDAFAFVEAWAASAAPFRDVELRQLHARVTRRSAPDLAGRYRDAQRSVEGSLTTFAAPEEIEDLVTEFTAWLAGQPEEAKTAIEAHERLVSIHPFADGNGRTARLVMSAILLRGGYPLLIVRAEDRPEYDGALEAIQLGGPRAPYERLMTERLFESFDRYLPA